MRILALDASTKSTGAAVFDEDMLVNYDCFTDIVFSQTKGIGCQARTCALYKYLRNNNLFEKFIKNPYKFGFMYKNMYRYN